MTTPDPDAEWWTTSDVAEYLGVQIGTVSSYRNRNQMPEPDQTLGRTHLWRPETIINWHEGRPRIGIGGRPGGADRVGTYLQVSTAVETRDAAEKLAREVVEAKLSAGAQIIGPVISAFWHLGEFGTGEEWQLLLKTHSDKFDELQAYLTEHHPWKNPEIIALPIVAGSESYLSWVRRTVAGDDDR
ncbi:divalent-cation tolerance protein CutA [Micromonospora sp. NPDC004551]|uniref:divalent-cation tolerance protein CutA n=1 Tax=Micromonospora sp. NPDC004551 TaxID=3154284 RepID=UPI0033A3BEB1